jgi:Ca-activated chloride channel homolog
MDPQHVCPSETVWQELLQGGSPDAGGTRSWLDIAAVLHRPVPPVPTACRRALENVKNYPPSMRPNMTARIHIERMMHRGSIAVSGESTAAYALLKLVPSGLAGSVRPLHMNLALALDVSGSMYEEDGTGSSRLQRVQEAAIGAIRKLQPDDTLAIIGFAHNARVLLPPTPLAEKSKIEDIIRRIDSFDVDPGGTAMDEGLALALTDVEKHTGAGKLSQVVVLTDGETSGEQKCRALAQQAAEKKIHLTLMGVGLDWKAALMKDLANLSQGKWCYIDVSEAQETERIFAQEFEALAATAFMDVELRLRPAKDVRIKRMRQVVPEIKEVKLEPLDERNLVARLGTLQQAVSSRHIIELSLPRRPDGKYAVAQLELSYDLGTGRRESSGELPLEMAYTAAGHGYVNAEVMKHIDDIQLKAMSDRLEEALERNDPQAAKQSAQEMEKKAGQMGERGKKKTMLAQQVLQELNASGRVSKKTQLAMEDAARLAEMPVESAVDPR